MPSFWKLLEVPNTYNITTFQGVAKFEISSSLNVLILSERRRDIASSWIIECLISVFIPYREFWEQFVGLVYGLGQK